MQMLKPWRSNSSLVGELSGKTNAGKNAAEAQLVNRVTDTNKTNPISNLDEGETWSKTGKPLPIGRNGGFGH